MPWPDPAPPCAAAATRDRLTALARPFADEMKSKPVEEDSYEIPVLGSCGHGVHQHGQRDFAFG